MNKGDRDLLIEQGTLLKEILRRMDNYDKMIVPRPEYEVTVNELRKNHTDNQVEIKELQQENKKLIWKVSGSMGALNLITSIVLYLLTK